MPHYLLQGSYTAEGAKGLLAEGGSSRIAQATALLESVGGTVECLYFAYGADDIIADKKVRNQFADLQEDYGALPVCMAKTQYSFSTDPNLKGAPSGHVIQIREMRLAAGAGFIVVVCGEIMTMPGLPRVPAANSINVDESGNIVGLF